MRSAALVLFVAGVYVLHQDFWFWRTARPLAFGFLPAGLWYHALYTLVTVGVLALLARWCWPTRLDRESRD